MRFPFRLKSVRLRLTAWYIATLSLVLLVYSLAVYGFFRNYLLTDLDLKLREDLETTEERLADFTNNPKALGSSEGQERWALDVWDSASNILYASAPTSLELLGPPAKPCAEPWISSATRQLADGLYLRVACKAVKVNGKTYLIRSARSADRIYDEIHQILMMMILGVPVGIFASAYGGYLLARRALKPVSDMTRKASTISAERLGERLTVENHEDELGQLAETFNATFQGLERSFDQMRRFTADASHELRTPLTAIRTVGEVSLRESRSTDEYRETVSSMLEEADRLRQLVDSLLTLSRADSDQLKLQRTDLDLCELCREVVNQVGVLAEEKEQILELDCATPVMAVVDRAVLRQAVINLVDNAVKYGGRGAKIRISVSSGDKDARIQIEDDGPGISPEHHAKIFERFYRVDHSRSREQGGTGLGLAIAKWAVEAHGGKILIDSAEGRGSKFTLVLNQDS